MRRIKRVTKYCPIEGNSLTCIYRKTCFGWKKIIQYRMILTECRTIGFMEPYLGLPSVPQEYGEMIGHIYVYQLDFSKVKTNYRSNKRSSL